MLRLDGRSFVESLVIVESFLGYSDGICLRNVRKHAHEVERNKSKVRWNYLVPELVYEVD